jgi:hypothetical protein
VTERYLPLTRSDADRAPDVVDLDHGNLAAGRQAALIEISEQKRGLALGDLRNA